MTRYRLEIRVTPRPGLLDPEGKAIHHALAELGFAGVEEVRAGKALLVEMEASSEASARESADAMCRKLLANPVTEDFEVEVLGEAAAAGTAGPGGEEA